MAIPSELLSMVHFVTTSAFNCSADLLEPKIHHHLNHERPILEDLPSAVITKKNPRLSSKNFGLSIVPVRTSGVSGELFTPGTGKSFKEQPNSAVLLKSGCKLFENEGESKYLDCYERGEKFLDKLDFKIVEPGVENKVRNYVKVLARSQSLMEETLDSPLYAGSPSLRGIGDSSLMARRTNSRANSPLVISKDAAAEDSPLSTNKYSSNTRTSPIPQKISRFGDSSRRLFSDSINAEEEKNEIDDKVFSIEEKTVSKCMDVTDGEKILAIEEVIEPHTPSFDPGASKNQQKLN